MIVHITGPGGIVFYEFSDEMDRWRKTDDPAVMMQLMYDTSIHGRIKESILAEDRLIRVYRADLVPVKKAGGRTTAMVVFELPSRATASQQNTLVALVANWNIWAQAEKVATEEATVAWHRGRAIVTLPRLKRRAEDAVVSFAVLAQLNADKGVKAIYY